MLNWGRFFVLFLFLVGNCVCILCNIWDCYKLGEMFPFLLFFFWWIGGNHFIRGELGKFIVCILRNVFDLKGRWVNSIFLYFFLGNEIKLLIIQIKLFDYFTI